MAADARAQVASGLHPGGRDGAGYLWTLGALEQGRARCLAPPAAAAGDASATGGEEQAFLAAVLEEIGNHVAAIKGEQHYALVERVFHGISSGRGLSPWFLSQGARRALLDVTAHFVVNGAFASAALAFLVGSFSPPMEVRPVKFGYPSEVDAARGFRCTQSEGKPGGPDGAQVGEVETILGELAHAVETCLNLAPTVREEFVGIVLAKMPHKYVDVWRSQCYVAMVLWLAEKSLLNSASDRFLGRIVERLVELDVEVNWGVVPKLSTVQGPPEALEEDTENDSLHVSSRGGSLDEIDEADLFEVSTLNVDEVQRQQQQGKDPLARVKATSRNHTEASSPPAVISDPNLLKMDLLLHMTLQYLKSAHDSGQGSAIHTAILDSFQRAVFPVHKGTRFVQFLVFYSCSRQPDCRRFTSFLISIFLDASFPVVLRTLAALYLGNLVARAGFVSSDLAGEVLDVVSCWCVQFCKRNPVNTGEASAIEDIGVFHAAFQALVCSFCLLFASRRNRRMDEKLHDFLQSLHLGHVCEHWTCPVAACIPSTVEEFLKGAVQWRVLSTRAAEKLRGGVGRLSTQSDDAYSLPFDLWRLDLSSKFIENQSSYRMCLTHDLQADQVYDYHGNAISASKGLQFRAGSSGRNGGHIYPESLDIETDGSYPSDLSFQQNTPQYGDSMDMKHPWLHMNQRPIPIGAQAQDILYKKQLDGQSVSPVVGSMNADLSPDFNAMSIGRSFNESKFL